MSGSIKKTPTNLKKSFLDDFSGVAIEYKSNLILSSIKGKTKEITGFSDKDLISGKVLWQDIIHPDDRIHLRKEWDSCVSNTPNYSGFRKYRIIKKDGQIQLLGEQIQCKASGKSNSIKGLIFKLSEPTDFVQQQNHSELTENEILKEEVKKRKRAEAGFLKEKEFLSKILNSFSYPFYLIDVETYKVNLANNAAYNLYGNKSTTCYEFSHQKNTPCVEPCLCPLKIVRETKKPCITEHIHFDQDNNPCYFSVHGFPVFDENGEVSQLIEYSFDITEKRKAELALIESEEKYRLLFNNERDAIALLDCESYEIIDANRTAIELYQFEKEELRGMKILELSAEPEKTAKIKFSGEVGDSIKFDLRWHKKKDGTVFPVEISAGFFIWKDRKTICVIVRDITERKEREEMQLRLEKRLATTQKMNAIGTLAGGIAHDFNNLLFAQIGYLEMALGKLPTDNVCHEYVDESLKASMRAAELVAQILTFSRSDHVLTEPISIAPILKETVKMLASSISSRIKINTKIDVKCHNVIGNPVQIQQIILNISSNAEYAMKNRGGELYFELQNQELNKESANNYGFDNAGTYVSLVISDTGDGMAAEVKERVFEPYYTTKPYWQGGGMGLAVVHGIVENNMGGVISVDSRPKQGSRFKMLFPALVEGKEPPKSAFIEEKKKLLKNQIVVLFIDNEEMSCEMGKTVLTNMGFHVITHTDPVDAIHVFKKESQFIDIVITSQIMPGMTGIQLAREISEIKSGIQVILMTKDKLEIGEKLEKIGITQTVSKPVSKHILNKVISKVLKTKGNNHNE